MQDAHLNAVIITVNLMSVVGEVPQAFIVHRENPRHSCLKKPLSLKEKLCVQGLQLSFVGLFYFQMGTAKARMGSAVWSSNVVWLKVQQLHSARQACHPPIWVVLAFLPIILAFKDSHTQETTTEH